MKNLKELLQDHIGLKEEVLEGFVYEDALQDYGIDNVNQNLLPIIKALPSFSSSLELGSGNGSFSWKIKESFPDNIVCTADVNKDASKLWYYGNLNHFILRTDEPFLITENENGNPFKFDLILSFEHFEHISPNKLNILGKNLIKHSKKGTIFFGSAPSYDRGYCGGGLVHPNCKSQEQWDIWFKDLGFEKLTYSILNNRDYYKIPYAAYVNSNELFYIYK